MKTCSWIIVFYNSLFWCRFYTRSSPFFYYSWYDQVPWFLLNGIFGDMVLFCNSILGLSMCSSFFLGCWFLWSKNNTYLLPTACFYVAAMLYWNLVTLMLWDRYPLVYSNPSKFSLEKWRNKLTLAIFPSFALETFFPHWQKALPKEQRASTAPDTWARICATSPTLTTRSSAPLAPPICFIAGGVLEFWRKK